MEIKVLKKVLDVNEKMAAENRAAFQALNLFVVNVMSSPGSGKTTLLEKTLVALKDEYKCGVVVGDICTTRDADRLMQAGDVPVTQICTEPFGGDCHLAAHVVMDAARQLDLQGLDVLIIENVGNLVCPAEFDIGEDKRVVVLSVTEGEDKPLKYPLMFRVCDAAVLSKTDLLPHLDYDRDFAIQCIQEVNAPMRVFPLSARSGDGLGPWLEWLKLEIGKKKEAVQ
ncbi:MAG: hydrogenase nickel incorporation protein HypB [Deltaproteobacteria bacterium]|nr:hydrogenase nickel incorporation protein HypB [Deltaproteobacteria bacterium]